MHNALELFDEQIISKILLIYVNDKTYEYDNVFQIDDFCIILLKRRFLRYLVQKPEVSARLSRESQSQ